jgi:hypothetical protein
MAKLFSRATVSGSSLPGAPLKAALTALWDALNSAGFTDVARTSITGTGGTLATTQCGFLQVDASGGNVSRTLPASGSGSDDAIYIFHRTDGTGNTAVISANGTDTIAGAASISIPPSGQIELQLPAGSTTWRVIGMSGPTAQASRNVISASADPFRNRIINGSCYEDQRNSGAAQTFTAGAALAYCIDRFYAYCTGANVSGQQITASDATKRYRFTGAAGVTGIGIGQRIEAGNSVDLAGNVCTLSVKLSNSLLTTVNWAAYYANTNDSFGTVASPTRTAIASSSFAVSAVEGLYTASISVPAAATTGIEIVFTVGAQTSGTWTLGEVQLEKGSILAAAVSFERVDVAINKQRCQRYYEVGDGFNSGYNAVGSAIDYRQTVPFKVTKRTVPALSYSVSGASNVSAYDARLPTINSLMWYCTAIASSSWSWLGAWAANAEL